MCSCLIQPGMEEMNPRIRIRLRHPKERPLPFLNGMLLHIRQNEELFVSDRGSRTMVIGTVTPARTGLPIHRAVLQIGRHRVFERRQQRGKFWLSSPCHRL